LPNTLCSLELRRGFVVKRKGGMEAVEVVNGDSHCGEDILGSTDVKAEAEHILEPTNHLPSSLPMRILHPAWLYHLQKEAPVSRFHF